MFLNAMYISAFEYISRKKLPKFFFKNGGLFLKTARFDHSIHEGDLEKLYPIDIVVRILRNVNE